MGGYDTQAGKDQFQCVKVNAIHYNNHISLALSLNFMFSCAFLHDESWEWQMSDDEFPCGQSEHLVKLNSTLNRSREDRIETSSRV